MNRVTLSGRPTNEPEIKKDDKGTVYCRLRLAVDKPYRGKNVPRESEYFNVVCFGNLARTVYNNLAVGALCIVEGKLSQDVYTDKLGMKREKNSIIANRLEIIEWLRKRNAISKLDNLSDSELLVPREITKSLVRQLEVSAYDEDIPAEILGKDPFTEDD